MALTPPPSVPSFGGATPQRGDRATFSSRVDAFLVWFLGNFVGLIAAINSAYANALEAFNSASAAANATNTALTLANATPWVSGTVYAQNDVAISQVNFQAYRRRVAGAGAVDPSSDSANWILVIGNATNGAFVPVVLAGTEIDLRLGNYFIDTVGGAKTYTITNCPSDCYAFTLDVTLNSGSLAFPAIVKTTGNIPVTMSTGKSHMLMFVTKDRGVGRWRLSVAPNFDI